MKTVKIDKRFVLTAILILATDTFILMVCYFLFGKEVMGIVGACLTAVCIGIHKNFPKLKFERATESQKRTVSVQNFSWYSLLSSICIFLGSQVACGILFGVILFAWTILIDPHLLSTYDSLSQAFKRILISPNLMKFSLVFTFLSFFIGGLLIGKTIPSSTYRYAIVGSFLYAFVAIGAGILVESDLYAFVGLNQWPTLQMTLGFFAKLGVYWFLFIWISWVGARVTTRQSLQPPSKMRRKKASKSTSSRIVTREYPPSPRA